VSEDASFVSRQIIHADEEMATRHDSNVEPPPSEGNGQSDELALATSTTMLLKAPRSAATLFAPFNCANCR